MKLGKVFTLKKRPLAALIMLGIGIVAVPFNAAVAQEVQETALESSATDNADTDEKRVKVNEQNVEEVQVTGSRLKRSTYSSVAPLQIISGQVSRESGLMNAADILQSSTASAGQQIDLTFGGYVLDNGPGSTNVDIRGLGGNRTLLMLNGRRMAPAGVEGAPNAPDLGLIPTSLVSQYDILLDGASSVYGSDAIAGVVNVIMRKDFDGLELEAFTSQPEYGGGEENTFNLAWGKNFDRGYIGFGAEYQNQNPVTLADRPWTEGCRRPVEIDENGNISTDDVFYESVYGMNGDGCYVGSLGGRISVPTAGSIYYTPGYSNGGWNNFSESNQFGFGIDGNGDGVTDVNFYDYDVDIHNQSTMVYPDRSQMSLMAYGEYTFEGDANITPYFEMLYAKRKTYYVSDAAQLFPDVPALNPFNICNPDAEGGVDCAEAWNMLMENQDVIDKTLAMHGCDPSAGGSCDQTVEPSGAASSTPIVAVRGDRSIVDVSVEQARFVSGVSADLPFINFGSFSNWSVDTSFVYSKSKGTSRRPGVREDRLNYALGFYSSDNTPCVNDTGEALASDVEAGCVPVNMYASSLYENPIGDFATVEERNYVFDDRDFDTEYEQTIFSTFASGELFRLPAETVSGVIGLEWRKDAINSMPDHVANDGLLFGFFSDGGAKGDKVTQEVFGELEVPLLVNTIAAEELTVNLSARWTDDEIYGAGTTSSVKVKYRPIDSLLLRYTQGSSFRAPNLREVFLQPQTSFGSITDPCFIPDGALNEITGEYDPTLDSREQHVLDNCLAQGVDPTVANNGGFNTYDVEVSRGGTRGLEAETSDAISAGFAWEAPTGLFDLTIGATYYELKIKNTIIEPSASFIVGDCYETTTVSAFCDRITRDLSDPEQPFLSMVDSSFLNRDEERARGVDINIAFDDTFTIASRPFNIGFDINANHTKSRSTLFVYGEEEEVLEEEYAGSWGFPDWKVRSAFRAEFADWKFTWASNFISSIQEREEDKAEFSDINGTSATCFGLAEDGLCRPYGDAGSYITHDLSVYYSAPSGWRVGGGVRNVFDKEPPMVDGAQVTSIRNAPLGYGYDLHGRTLFLNVAYTFGGNE
ncbi:Vitamin B12 transporter BtuB [Thalassocella blandensis]|nr:Vitamin B12 transporter BtuB [Thalassocella blandensis]